MIAKKRILDVDGRWPARTVRPTMSLETAKREAAKLAWSISIPNGTYELINHDNEVALLRPVVRTHFLHTKWFFVTDVEYPIPTSPYFSKQLPVITGPQDLKNPSVHHNAPTDPAWKLWRYMPLSNLEMMLQSSSIWFCRASIFEDEHEGLLSLANEKFRPQIYKMDHPLANALDSLKGMLKAAKEWTYVSCWNQDQAESDFMWRNDTGSGPADVAVQTTYGWLREYTHSIFCATVEYVDYEGDWIPEGNTLFPFFHKRKDRYWRENEFRAIIQRFPKQDVEFDQTEYYDLNGDGAREGLQLQLDLNDLLENVVLSPRARFMVARRVKKLVRQFNIVCPVTRSALAR